MLSRCWPTVSPDARTVAFARYSQDTSANVYVVALTGGEPCQLTADKASMFGLAWVPDADLVLSSDRERLVSSLVSLGESILESSDRGAQTHRRVISLVEKLAQYGSANQRSPFSR
jgi:hypothetical protein